MLASRSWNDCRLILFTEQATAKRLNFQAFAKSTGASDLMIPSDIVVIETIPVLGVGKVDNVAVGKLAQQQFAQKTAAVA